MRLRQAAGLALASTTRPTAQTWLVTAPSAPCSSLLPGRLGLETWVQVAWAAAGVAASNTRAAARARIRKRLEAAMAAILAHGSGAMKPCDAYEPLTTCALTRYAPVRSGRASRTSPHVS